MAKTFSLASDKQFIHTATKDEKTSAGKIVALYVSEYKGDQNGFDITRAGDDGWVGQLARVSNDPDQLRQGLATHEALEVNGVTIQGERLTELFNDLAVEREADRAKKSYLMTNRQGLCLVNVGGSTVKKVRVNDYFGWSKYGVKPAAGEWKRVDMANGQETGGGDDWWKWPWPWQ
ncbi:unnamed protein product [Linum trigynum]|uniref:PDZ domain-containing protein n=1 Tax=Linum trigynum TaxID=586398 RepID=A0AAV2FNE3_9ROSI